MPARREQRFELPDPVIGAVNIGDRDLVGLLPKQVDDVDALPGIMNPKDSPQPTLLVDRLPPLDVVRRHRRKAQDSGPARQDKILAGGPV